jgi:hypothetical protein
MPKFETIPVVVGAVQYTGDNAADILEFLGKSFSGDLPPQLTMFVNTPNGTKSISKGDWVVRGPGSGYDLVPDAVFHTLFKEITS